MTIVIVLAFLLIDKVVIHPYWARKILIYACYPEIIIFRVSFRFKKYLRLIKCQIIRLPYS